MVAFANPEHFIVGPQDIIQGAWAGVRHQCQPTEQITSHQGELTKTQF